MRILITGGSGLVGSWVARVLAKHHEVIVLIRKESSDYRLLGIENVKVNRRESSDWAREIEILRPEILVLGDWWGVENAFRNDERQLRNVDRYKKLIDVAHKVGVKQILGIGSQAELGPVEYSVTEQQPDNPTTLYGEAKVLAKNYLLDSNTSDTSTKWLRIFSTYGPLDTGNWLIPNTIRALLADQKMDLTQGDQEWSYLFILDLAGAFEVAISAELNGIINVGDPKTLTIKELISDIGQRLHKSHLLNFGVVPYRVDQVMKMAPICESLTQAGWSPTFRINDGISETLAWMQNRQTSLLNSLNVPNFIPEENVY